MKINHTIQATLIGTAVLTALFVLWQGTGQPQPETAQTEMGFIRTFLNMAAWVLDRVLPR